MQSKKATVAQNDVILDTLLHVFCVSSARAAARCCGGTAAVRLHCGGAAAAPPPLLQPPQSPPLLLLHAIATATAVSQSQASARLRPPVRASSLLRACARFACLTIVVKLGIAHLFNQRSGAFIVTHARASTCAPHHTTNASLFISPRPTLSGSQ